MNTFHTWALRLAPAEFKSFKASLLPDNTARWTGVKPEKVWWNDILEQPFFNNFGNQWTLQRQKISRSRKHPDLLYKRSTPPSPSNPCYFQIIWLWHPSIINPWKCTILITLQNLYPEGWGRGAHSESLGGVVQLRSANSDKTCFYPALYKIP